MNFYEINFMIANFDIFNQILSYNNTISKSNSTNLISLKFFKYCSK